MNKKTIITLLLALVEMNMKQIIITILFALVAMAGQAQEPFFRTDSAFIIGKVNGIAPKQCLSRLPLHGTTP